ncbi:TMhelix containing protein [Vibrio phage 1.084.O._10N.261.49.F5]|nr:TMhelix containing protein [Vibrio phage 1.084.O._10N.261.49.F5]
MPFAMRAMTKAAVESGLIDGSLTQQKQEAALFKLMENGKLISAEVLPNFGKALRELANDGDAVSIALANNMNPRLGVAKNIMTELANEMYKGLKPAIMSSLDAFNDLGKESALVARILGNVVGDAIFTILTPFRFLAAAVYDVSYWMSDLLGLSEDTRKSMMAYGPAVVGAALGVMVLVKSLRLLAGAYRMVAGGKKSVDTVGGLGSQEAGKSGKGGGGIKGSNLLKGAGLLGLGAVAVTQPLMIENQKAKSGFSEFFGEKLANTLKLEVDVRGTDGLIEVTDQRAMVLSERMANSVFDKHMNNALGSLPNQGNN